MSSYTTRAPGQLRVRWRLQSARESEIGMCRNGKTVFRMEQTPPRSRHRVARGHPKLPSGPRTLFARVVSQGEQPLDYTLRVRADKLIARSFSVRAQSEPDALVRAEQRIRPELKQLGYEFRLEIIKARQMAPEPRLNENGNRNER
jgi:hypothetical protein